MSNIIAFESNALPAYLANADVASLNNDLTSHAGSGFPVISIKGKVFTVVRDGERNILTKDIDGEKIPTPSIDVVLLKANKNTSKVFYIKGYQEGAENVKPDCFSNDGTHPDSSSESPQAKSCATCPHNEWGSKVGDNGATKGKACQDTVRMAIATPDQLNDPYLIRVPPASIRALGEYGAMLKKRGVGYNAVVTKIGFDMESPSPKLTFKPVGFLDEAGYRAAQESAASDVTKNILGQGFTAAAAPAAAAIESKPEAKVDVPPVVTPKETVTSAPAAKAVKEEMKVDLSLDDLSFDD